MKTTSLNPSPFQVYNASAGAGKTYQLVQNYLELCLCSANPDGYLSILAITFTNKAAHEMKERLVQALLDLAVYPHPAKVEALATHLSEKLAVHPKRLAHRAEATLSHILHHYSAFSISTIDSFTNRVIRSFSRDLKMSSYYQVELDADLLLKEALDLLFERLNRQSKTTLILTRFINRQLQEGKSPQVYSALFSLAKKTLFNENALPYLQKLQGFTADEFLALEKELRQKQKTFAQQIKESAHGLLQFMEEKGLEQHFFSRQVFPKWVIGLENGEVVKPGTMAQKQISGENDFHKKADSNKPAGLALRAHEDTLRAEAQKILAQLEQGLDAYLLRSQILGNFYTLAILAEVEQALQEVKEESNRLPIADFNKIISAHLRQQPAPFIYEKIGSRYRHYFIDEFQDTSQLQWQNLQPLLENTLATEGGSLMLVGDAKQAIYRWRGGAVEQFIDLAEVPENPRLPLEHRAVEHLGSNWRSAETIVNFNNRFFAFCGQKLGHPQKAGIYQKAAQKAQLAQEGLVQISYLPQEQEGTEAYAQAQCERCLALIHQAMERGYSQDDVTILVRGNKEGARIAQYLLEQEINVVSPDSLTLSASPVVQAVISFFTLLHRPFDRPARVPWLEFLYAHLENQPAELHLFLEEHAKAPLSDELAFYQQRLKDWDYAKFEQKGLAEKAYYLLESLALNFRDNAFVQRFLDLLDTFEQQESASTAAFLRYWEQSGAQTKVELPPATEAVKIMTIHKAKGLEFPIVIYAFADLKLTSENDAQKWVYLPESTDFAGLPVALLNLSNSFADKLWEGAQYHQWLAAYKQDLHFDQLNLVYVAFTRAVKELYILSSDKPASKQNPEESLPGLLPAFAGREGVENQTWGSLTYADKEKKPPAQNEVFNWEDRMPWEKALRVSDGAPKNWSPEVKAESLWGTKIHHLLAQVREAAQVEEAVENAIRAGDFAADEKPQLLQSLEQVVLHPQLQAFFQPGLEVLNERSIISPGQTQKIPDRIVLEGKVAHVLDYKTGKPLPAHKQQVDDYQRLLEQMGYTPGHRILIYLGQTLEVVQDWSKNRIA